MEPTINEVLLARALKDAQSQPSYTDAALMGALPGAVVGIAAGQGVKSFDEMLGIGKGINNLKDRYMASKGYIPADPRLMNRMKAGSRAAGGLVGLIAGGALGMGMKKAMETSSPAGELLSKRMTQESLSPEDQARLQMLLAETYNQMGIS